MTQPISITAISSISSLGYNAATVWSNYQSNKHFISKVENDWVSKLSEDSKKQIEALRHSNSKYRQLDNSVLYAIFAARKAVKDANWLPSDNFGINIGSSRGATSLFEYYHANFLDAKKTSPLSSPTTTLGNISSWVAHDLKSKGPEISHSITCSTALHAMLNGIAWITSGMTDKFLAGGSEAPLTPFTIAQMKALKIYSKKEKTNSSYPCQSLNFGKTQNTMVLGEAAALACLEKGKKEDALAYVTGFGYGTELLEHNASLSTEANCFQDSMRMALGKFNPEDIDIIVTHTPGTIKGDKAEHNAIYEVFQTKIPALTSNKWKLGHSLGASGLLSIELAVLMLQHQEFIPVPFIEHYTPERIQNIMINAVGFGGNAVSIILSKPHE